MIRLLALPAISLSFSAAGHGAALGFPLSSARAAPATSAGTILPAAAALSHSPGSATAQLTTHISWVATNNTQLCSMEGRR